MSEWIRVCAQAELLPGEYKVAWDGDVAIAVFNIDGELYAIEDVCTHDGGELTGGELHGYEIECPRHGAHFDGTHWRASLSTGVSGHCGVSGKSGQCCNLHARRPLGLATLQSAAGLTRVSFRDRHFTGAAEHQVFPAVVAFQQERIAAFERGRIGVVLQPLRCRQQDRRTT